MQNPTLPSRSAGAAYTNPVYHGGFGDPYVWKTGDTYYAVGTGDDPQHAAAAGDGRVIPLLRSADLARWEYVAQALVPAPDDARGPYWAPEVVEDGGKFYLYYSVGVEGHVGHQLRVGVGDRPEGPYADAGRPLLSREKVPFAIDPHAFRDADGQWYLYYARDFLDTDAGARAGTALVVDRLIGMTRLAGEERVVMRARCDWQLYQAQRDMYGTIYDWHTLEGPAVRFRDGKYYCFYSGGCFQNDTYGVDYGVADSPLGPYRGEGSEAGPRVLKTVPGKVIGPGHCSIVPGPDGVTDYLIYHAWGPDMKARRMCVDELVWTENGPRCLGPTWTPQVIKGG